jgi:hypothetical protein
VLPFSQADVIVCEWTPYPAALSASAIVPTGIRLTAQARRDQGEEDPDVFDQKSFRPPVRQRINWIRVSFGQSLLGSTLAREKRSTGVL